MSKVAELWLGDDDSYQRLQSIQKKIESAPEDLLKQARKYEKTHKKMGDWEDFDSEEEDELGHWMLEMQGDVAVISVAGPMSKGTVGFWGQYYGYCGYDDIREACLTAIANGAKEFLFDWDTTGGAADGIEDISDFLRSLNADYGTTSFCSGTAASAGLWLATSARNFYGTKMASIGSIGVIAVHREITKMLEIDGVTPRVFRSAPFKALGNPYEKLSKLGVDTIQKDIDTAHGFFVDAIAQNRRMSAEFVSERLATGEIWYGEEALSKGLIDGLKTFDDVFVALSKKTVENTTNYRNPSQGIDMKTKRISAKTAAAIASGVPLDVALSDEPVLDESLENEEVPTEVIEETTQPTEASTTVLTATLESTGLLTALSEQLVDAKVKLATAEATVASMQASHEGMKKVVALAIQRAYVGMGSPAPDMDGLLALDASLLVQQHASADAQLAKRFGAGQQISLSTNDEDEADSSGESLEEYQRKVRLDLAKIKKS